PSLRIAGLKIGRKRDHVALRQLGDDGLHKLDAYALARAALHVVELAEYVSCRPSDDRRAFTQAFEILSVAERAGDGLTVAAGGGQRFAFGNAARRHVIVEADVQIAELHFGLVLGQHDDAISD